MKLQIKSIFAAVTVGMLALVTAPEAKAVATLRIYDGTGANATITDVIADGQATAGFTDVNGAGGAVTYVSTGQFAGWMFTVSTGANVGTQGQPNMTLSISYSFMGTIGSSLTFEFSDTSFSGPPTASFNAVYSGTISNATATYSTYRDNANNLFADGTDADGFKNINGSANVAGGATAGTGASDLSAQMTSKAYVGTGGAVGETLYTSAFTYTTPYSLTQKITLQTTGTASSGSIDLRLQAPDGGMTAALLGFAFIGIAIARRKLIAA